MDKLVRRDKVAFVFYIVLMLLMIYLQSMQYSSFDNKTIKNIFVIFLFSIAVIASLTEENKRGISNFSASIYLFLAYTVFVEFLTGTLSLENFYYLSLSFIMIIGGRAFSSCFKKEKLQSIVKFFSLIIFAYMTTLFFINFSKLGFISAGVQTSIVYPLMMFVVIAIFFDDIIPYLCSLPLFVAAFMLMARSVVLLTATIVLIKIIKTTKGKYEILKKILLFAVAVVVVVAAFRYVLNNDGTNILDKGTAVGSDFSSGRLDIYNKSFNYFLDSNPIKMLLGNGASACSKLFGISGHSDIVQFLLNFGIIGCIWFISLHMYCISNAFKNSNLVGLIELAVFLFYILINQFFLSVGPSIMYGFIIGIFSVPQVNKMNI